MTRWLLVNLSILLQVTIYVTWGFQSQEGNTLVLRLLVTLTKAYNIIIIIFSS